MLICFALFSFSGCAKLFPSPEGENNTIENPASSESSNEPEPSEELGTEDESGTKEPGTKEPEPAEEPGTATEPASIEEQIENMTLEEKIGQLLITGFKGTSPDGQVKTLIQKYHVGGLILFKRNIADSTQLLDLMNGLKAANGKNRIPLFLAIDEEGGKISRMPEELVNTPACRVIGGKNDRDFAFEIGSAIGYKIKSFGFNLNFAPVLDIDSNPDNPVIGERSFGPDEKIVSSMGIQVMKGLQSQNIISVVKHFPGHGDTSVDSHVGLPAVDKEMESLMEFELVPFMEAIKHNTDGIMVAHILYNKIDPKYPSTMSEKIMTGLLREELKYDGVIFTDDLTMGAILENYDIGEAAVKSIKAGSDVLVVCHGYDNVIKVFNSLKKSVQNGDLTEARINRSLARILSLKNKYQISDKIISDVDVAQANEVLMPFSE